jgi:hypothetical protein
MAGIYTTSRGKSIDMNRLKLLNETTIAVGNAGVNARGDLVKGNKIIKSREEIAQEHYNISGNNVIKNNRNREAAATEIVSDVPAMNFQVNKPIKEVAADIDPQDVPTMNFDDHLDSNNDVAPASAPVPRGGLASMVKNQTQGKNT